MRQAARGGGAGATPRPLSARQRQGDAGDSGRHRRDSNQGAITRESRRTRMAIINASIPPMLMEDGGTGFCCAACGETHCWWGCVWGSWDSGERTIIRIRKNGEDKTIPIPIRYVGRLSWACAQLLPDFRESREPGVSQVNAPCGCGCGAAVRRRFLPGHDGRLAGWLVRFRAGKLDTSELSGGERAALDLALAENDTK